jgi:glycosyltransferase involved in cell wall biosynthesis
MHLRVLMSTCNGAPWLQAQLDSLVAQTHRDWSLWVSDDGSTDGTRALLDRFDKKMPGRLMQVVDGPRQGSAANFLSLICDPDLPPGPVVLADQDDVWLPDKMCRALAALADDTQPAGYAARYHVSDSTLSRHRLSPLWRRGPSFGNALVQNIMSGHSTALNGPALALIRQAGRVQVPHHDWWIYQLLSGAEAHIHLDTTPVLFYRQHAGNLVGTREGMRGRLARLAMIRQNRLSNWIGQNVEALKGAHDLLTPRSRACLETFCTLSSLPSHSRPAAMRRAGIIRQTHAESGLIYALSALGRL